MAVFNIMFSHQVELSLVELVWTRQFLGEDHDLYVKRFQDKTLDYCDLVEEKSLS